MEEAGRREEAGGWKREEEERGTRTCY